MPMGRGETYHVRVILYECSDLLAADSVLEGGKSDPYVVFTVGDTTHKSSRKNNDLNPKWGPPEKFEFTVHDWEYEFILVNVFDHDTFSKDDLIGSAVIPLALYSGGRHQDLYRYPLVLPDEVGEHGPRSDIHLQITLTTSDGQPVHYYY
jgi:Ca2+-dependent lipid-binding protein